jgi:transcriptional regulator of acetoin/glycerol metabolism
MNGSKIEEAKRIFIETGRLNRNVIRDDISISWYRCRLNHLSPKSKIESKGLSTEEVRPSFRHYAEALNHYLDHLIDEKYHYFICDAFGRVVEYRSTESLYDEIKTIDESCLGTNAGALALNMGIYQVVRKEEHYLDLLSNGFTIGLPIKREQEILGVILLITDLLPSEYEINLFREGLGKFETEEVFSAEMPEASCSLNQLFVLPEHAFEGLERRIEQLLEANRPIVIQGGNGCGKTALAWFLNEKKHVIPYIFATKSIPKSFQASELEKALSQNESVIIEDYDLLSDKAISLLTVYTEEKLRDITASKSNNFKDQMLILTTDDNSDEKAKQHLGFQKLNNRLSMQRIVLPSFSDFADEAEVLIRKKFEQFGKIPENSLIEKLMKSAPELTFKQLADMIETEDYSLLYRVSVIESLSDHEAEYIQKVYELMDFNISATADALGIGRSTLYRKLEKYQNGTTPIK